MSRRTAALFALGLAVVLVLAAALQPVSYVTFKPGPTVNVLGDYQGEKVITIEGRKTYADGGELRLLTVFQSGPEADLDLATVFGGWISDSTAVLPKDAVYDEQDTADTVRQQSALQMSTSQDAATAAALRAAKIEFSVEPVVAAVEEGGAAAGLLEAGQVVLAIDGATVTTTEQIISRVRPLAPGSKVRFTVRVSSAGKPKEVVLTTRPAADDPTKSRVNITLAGQYTFPFDVEVGIGENIGGPSAGMIFALTIYDLLTPGSLTGGRNVAGTGTISADGQVGPIGGIAQKLVGAQRAGAELFLVPAANWDEATAASYDEDQMTLACVATLDAALTALTTWSADPEADLPGCPG